MKAIVLEQHGGPEVLQLKDVADPQPGAGEVRIKISYAGVNFIDVYHRIGLYPLKLPITPGSEAVGIVESVGENVGEFKVGDRVGYAMTIGAYAEYAIVPSSKLVAVPQEIPADHAAAAMLQGMTVHYLLRDSFRVGKGTKLLIHAAAGGVGNLLIQVAKHLGAFVIGTVSTEEKAKIAKEAGADEVILYTKSDFLQEVKRITGGHGLDVVYDSVGQSTFERSLDCLRPRGYLVLFGQSSGPVQPFNPGILAQKGSLCLTRPSLAHYTLTREELLQRANEVFDWMKSGVMKIKIDSVFTLADAAEAHRRLESRASSGKILLQT